MTDSETYPRRHTDISARIHAEIQGNTNTDLTDAAFLLIDRCMMHANRHTERHADMQTHGWTDI